MEKPIRVLHCIRAMNCGGAETFIMNVYRKIDRQKIQFDFLVSVTEESYYDDEIHSLGGNIYYVPGRRQGVFKRKKALNRFFKSSKGRYEAVHIHVSSLSDISALKVATKYNVPKRIIHAHNVQEGGSRLHKYLHEWHQIYIDDYVTNVFACSEDAAKWICSNKRLLSGNYSVINNAIDIADFKFNATVRQVKRKELQIDDKFVVGHIGRFADQKNHTFLIDIFKAVHDKNGNARLLLIGDGPLRGQIEAKVERLGLTNSVIFAGVRSDVNELLNAMDVFLFPSRYEGLGIVLVEAQTNGMPCIISDVIPKDVIITDLVTRLPLGESAGVWADAVLAQDSKERKNTFEDVKKAGFDIKKLSEELQTLYMG